MNKKKTIISIFVVVAIFTACFTSTYAADNDKMIIELKIGSNLGKVNGKTSQVEKPYVVNKIVMVPLSWVTTAIGAEVNKKDNSKIEIIYGDLEAELSIGSKNYTVSSETQKLTATPVIKNNITMVPLEFITKNFPVSVTCDINKGNIKIVLEDDGALSDLSFLTGGISSKKLGNSFYGWSLSIPSGSRVVSNNYKSNTVNIVNDSRNLYIYVSVSNKDDMTLTKLYDLISEDDSSVSESKLDLKADIPYFEYATESDYDETCRVKVFEKGDYFYHLTIMCDDELVTPEKLMADKFYENIVSSFDLNYKGNEKSVEDISKVKDGKVRFYNYVSLNETSKYLTWSMDIPVKWEDTLLYGDPLTTTINFDKKYYMKITTNTLDEGVDLKQYVDEIKNRYDKNFNPKLYSFIGFDSTTVAGMEAVTLKFNIKFGEKVYYVEELYFVKNGFVYEVSFYLPEKGYEDLIKEAINIIDKMNFNAFNKQNFLRDLELYKSKNLGVRVSKQDDICNFVNKKYNWTADIPGYWIKDSYDDSVFTFKNDQTATSIGISAIEKDSDYEANSTEKSEFGMDMIELLYKVKPTISETNEKGLKIKNYTYRMENADSDLYGTIVFKVFEKNNTIYCFESEIYDLEATEKAINEIDSIWKSFKITE